MGATLPRIARTETATLFRDLPVARISPQIQDVPWERVSRAVIAGQSHFLLSAEYRQLLVLGSTRSCVSAAEPLISFGFYAGREVRELTLNAEQLLGLTWSAEHRCFMDARGDTYEFFIETPFGR